MWLSPCEREPRLGVCSALFPLPGPGASPLKRRCPTTPHALSTTSSTSVGVDAGRLTYCTRLDAHGALQAWPQPAPQPSQYRNAHSRHGCWRNAERPTPTRQPPVHAMACWCPAVRDYRRNNKYTARTVEANAPFDFDKVCGLWSGPACGCTLLCWRLIDHSFQLGWGAGCLQCECTVSFAF